jgi:hypothetical protein
MNLQIFLLFLVLKTKNRIRNYSRLGNDERFNNTQVDNIMRINLGMKRKVLLNQLESNISQHMKLKPIKDNKYIFED